MELNFSLLGVAAIGSCDSMHDILTGKHLVVDELVHHGCSRIVPVLIKRYYFGKFELHIACFMLMKDFASYYYFGRSRPPEIQRSYLARTLRTWEFFCLCSPDGAHQIRSSYRGTQYIKSIRYCPICKGCMPK